MTAPNVYGVTDELAHALGKWVLYLSVVSPFEHTPEELGRAAPCLDRRDLAKLWAQERMWLVFDDEVTAMAAFGTVIGDDGPTKTNPYDGPARVFAYVTGPNGEGSENT